MAHRNLIAACSLAAGLAVLGLGAGHPAAAQGLAPTSRAGLGPVDAEALAAISPASVKYYKDKCLVCHGLTGKGDGEGSKALDPKPRSFADKEWQKSITDQQIRDVTVKGGPAVGKNAAMPAHPDLKGRDEVMNGLVGLIRAFGR